MTNWSAKHSNRHKSIYHTNYFQNQRLAAHLQVKSSRRHPQARQHSRILLVFLQETLRCSSTVRQRALVAITCQQLTYHPTSKMINFMQLLYM